MGSCSSKSQKKNVAKPVEQQQQNPKTTDPDVHKPEPEQKVEVPVGSFQKIDQLPTQQNRPEEDHQQTNNSRILTQKESPEKTPAIKPASTVLVSEKKPDGPYCYFFGVDGESNKFIYKFDPHSDSFTQLNCPDNMELYNMSSATYVSDSCIYITGGIDAMGSSISNRAYRYNPTTNTADELRQFFFQRYAHQSVFVQGSLYVIGGLSYDKLSSDGMEEHENLLKGVERYDTATRRWSKVNDMNYGRSLSLVVVYQEMIYVLGGYIGEPKRSRTIERLNPLTEQWEILSFKLPFGLESSFAFSPAPGQIQILGGQNSSGSVNLSYIFDFSDKTFIQKHSMNHERVLHKGFVTKEKVFVFGGDTDDTVEEYHPTEDTWTKQPSTFRSLLNIIKLFSCAQPTLEIQEKPRVQNEEKEANAENLRVKRCFVFGDDETSFILELNFSKNLVKEHNVPSILRLYGYQGVACLPDNTYLICGGVNKSTSYISSKTFIYNPQTRTAVKVAKCNDARYTFNFIVMAGYVYAIGGRTWGEDHEAILAKCERFNISTSQWEPIAKMTHPRCSAMAFQLRSKLYVLGGYRGHAQRWSDIEVYTPENNVWTPLKVGLKVALEGSSLIMANRTGGIFLLGGRTDEGDTSKIWDFDVEQGDMWEIGNLKEPKSLTKIYEFHERKVFILGGDQYTTELFDLTEGKPIETSKLGVEINQSLAVVLGRGRKADNKLLRFGLA